MRPAIAKNHLNGASHNSNRPTPASCSLGKSEKGSSAMDARRTVPSCMRMLLMLKRDDADAGRESVDADAALKPERVAGATFLVLVLDLAVAGSGGGWYAANTSATGLALPALTPASGPWLSRPSGHATSSSACKMHAPRTPTQDESWMHANARWPLWPYLRCRALQASGCTARFLYTARAVQYQSKAH